MLGPTDFRAPGAVVLLTSVPAADVVPARTVGRRLALALVVLVNAAFVLNNVASYLGLNYVAAMTMYASLNPGADNHLLLRRLSLTDAGEYVRLVDVATRGMDGNVAEPFEDFADWSAQRGRLVHLGFVRYQVSRLCRSGPRARVSLTLQTQNGQRREYRDACGEPSLLGYPLLTSYPECRPGCDDYVRRWAGSSPKRGTADGSR